MPLYLHLTIHVVLAVLAGFLVWRIWGQAKWAIFFALAGGVAIDLDHLVDYFLAFGMDFRLDYFISGYQFLKSDKIYVILHGWEFVVILLVIGYFLKEIRLKTATMALALGIFVHLAGDVAMNEIPVKSYSIIYRIRNNFEIKKLITADNYQRHMKEKEVVSFR